MARYFNLHSIVFVVFLVAAVLFGYFGFRTPASAQTTTPPEGESVEICIARNLSTYINEVTALLPPGGLSKVRLLSPAFNLTNPQEVAIFNYMVAPPTGAFNFTAANFNALDGWAGNTYTLHPGGTTIRAMGFYTSNGWASAFAGKPVVFTEYGDFATADIRPGDAGRGALIASMQEDFRQAVNGGIAGINYFAAYDDDDIDVNPEFYEPRHLLEAGEFASITAVEPRRAGLNQGMGTQSGAVQNKAEQLRLGWVTEIISGPDLGGPVDAINAQAGVNTVLRLCVGNSCGFSEPETLANYLIALDGAVNTNNVYVIVGPNEPATEHWAAQECSTTLDFKQDLIPCNATYETFEAGRPDFHSLRPYPASPCDNTLYGYAMCADDLVARVEYEFAPSDGLCTPLPDGSQSCDYAVETSMDVTIGLVDAELPVVGNTEDVPNSTNQQSGIPFESRMTEYVSWYLNGITGRAEEGTEFVGTGANITPEERTRRLHEAVNQGGPIKKLLPQAVTSTGIFTSYEDVGGLIESRQDEVRKRGQERHNQIVVCSSGIGLLNRPLPAACYSESDSWRRLSDAEANQAIRSSHHQGFASYVPMSSTEDLLGSVRSDLRGFSIGGTEEGAAGVTDMTFIPNTVGLPQGFRELYFAHMKESDELGDLLQGTYAPSRVNRAPSAPTPGRDAQQANPFCEPIEDPFSNPGDNLYGALERNRVVGGVEPHQGTISFTAEFTCIFPPPLPDTSCIANCIFNNPISPDPSQTVDEYCANSCGLIEPPNCRREVMFPMLVSVSTPLADTLWSRFVMGSMSIFRRMVPRVQEGSPIDEILDIPGETDVTYSSGNVNQISGANSGITAQAIAGSPFGSRSSSGSLYFPHLGSIHEYFLRGIQCAIRPYGLCEDEDFTGGDPDTQPDPDEVSDGSITCPFTDAEIAAAMQAAASKYNIPVSILEAIYQTEGAVYRTNNICEPNSASATGMMQVTDGTYNLVTCPSERVLDEFASCTAEGETLSRCDVEGIFELAARTVLQKTGRIIYGADRFMTYCSGGQDITRITQTYNLNWNDPSFIHRVACAYYGYTSGNCQADSLTGNWARGALNRGEILACRTPDATGCTNMDYGDWVCAWVAARTGGNFCNNPNNFPNRATS